MMNSLLRLPLRLLDPLTLVWLLLTIWVIRVAWLRLWRWAFLPIAAWLVLTVITCTSLPSWLIARLENTYAMPSPEAFSQADAIVCLGGGIEPSHTEPLGFHLVRGADRVATAIGMSVSGVAPVLVLGGGGYEHEGQLISEADAIAGQLANFSPLGFEVISLGICAHTRDEATKVAELAQKRGWKKVLLVTSASHLPRSVAVFKKLGVTVVPVPCHYLSSYNRLGTVDWVHLPHRGAFDIFDSWFHEFIGTWVYQWRGWI